MFLSPRVCAGQNIPVTISSSNSSTMYVAMSVASYICRLFLSPYFLSPCKEFRLVLSRGSPRTDAYCLPSRILTGLVAMNGQKTNGYLSTSASSFPHLLPIATSVVD